MLPTVSDKHRISTGQLDMPPRLLLGPGPSNAHPRVLTALATHQVGHLDSAFIGLMNEVQELLRYAWQTENEVTIPVSGTGSAAMEATFANLVEPGDKVLICINGYFGLRMVDMAERYQADVVTIKKPWGQVFSLEEIKEAINTHKPVITAIVHAETSTGALQPLEGLGDFCHENNCLLLVDSVTSLSGAPLFIDAWGIDACYSGAQKCLNCPPGVSPLTFSPRAMQKINSRKGKIPNWYLDITFVSKYWGSERTYHHTAPINMNYAMREALRIVAEEGLEARWKRHKEMAELFYAKLAEIGLEPWVAPECRLPPLTTVKVPEGIDSKAVSAYILQKYHIEIAAGLGELAGKVWRIGIMGYNARTENVILLVEAFRDALDHFGFHKQ